MDQHLSSAMDLLSTYKPSAQESHKKTPAIAFTHSGRGRVGPGRGRAFPDGHISGAMGFVCSSLDTVTWHHSCCQPDLVLAPVAAGAVHTSEQQEHAAVAIRGGAQDLSPHQGVGVQSDPGAQGRQEGQSSSLGTETVETVAQQNTTI